MKHAIGTAALALALAGCSGSGADADADGDGKISAAEAQAENKRDGGDLKPQPGKYKVQMKFVSAEGMPKEMQDMMNAMGAQNIEYCLTPEDAEEGFGKPPQESEDDSCTMTKYDIDGNTIDVAMTCKDDAGKVEGQMTMTGTVSPTKQDITVVTKGMSKEMGAESITMNMKQERIGDCDK